MATWSGLFQALLAAARSTRPKCGRWLTPRAGCRPGRNGGAMRSWPG
jgi:hypothetical protein